MTQYPRNGARWSDCYHRLQTISMAYQKFNRDGSDDLEWPSRSFPTASVFKCTDVQQFTRFQLAQCVARSLCDRRACWCSRTLHQHTNSAFHSFEVDKEAVIGCLLPRTGGDVWWMLTGWRPGVVDWSGGVFASCITRVQLYVNAFNWMAAVCAAAPLALAN